MNVSVIIPFLNASKHLPDCLQALAQQTYKKYELILVDNGSTDSSNLIVRNFISAHPEMRILLLEENTPGASAARNLGASAANGKWLIFTDADCIPDPNWLLDLTREMEGDKKIGALAGCIRPVPSEKVVAKFLGLFTLPSNNEEALHCHFRLVEGGFPTANMAVRRDLFNRIGGFDDSIPIYGEDYDLCAKIYDRGYCIKTLTNAVVLHNHRSDIRGLIRQSYSFGKAHALCLHRCVPGAIVCQVPMINFVRISAGARLWLDCNQADKKMLVTILAGVLWTPLFTLAFAYFVYLSVRIFRRAQQVGTHVGSLESTLHAGLMLLKSASMTLGRVFGSIRYRVFCI